jgi:hypothetical protein
VAPNKRLSGKGEASKRASPLDNLLLEVARLELEVALDSAFVQAVQSEVRRARPQRRRLGETPGPARTRAVRQLTADAEAARAFVKQNPDTARVMASWLTKRVHDLDLALGRAAQAQHELAIEAALREMPATRSQVAALAALIACGVRPKDAHNWIDSALRPSTTRRP